MDKENVLFSVRTDCRMYRLHWKFWCLRKKANTAELQDKLTGALIGLARSIDDNKPWYQKTPGRS